MWITIQYFLQVRKKRSKAYLEDGNYFKQAEGTFTVQYPKEKIPVPDHGRYQLDCEIDDCIVCDKCAKICPVNCIEIEPVRAAETFGHTSDGTPLRIHAAKFDIDMSKCFFCGLCTVVCPTECLTMTENYDFSTTNILDHNFSFSKMTESEIEEKKLDFENYQKEKAATKKAVTSGTSSPKPSFKPRVMVPKKKVEGSSDVPKPKMPVIKPKVAKPIISKPKEEETQTEKPKVVKPKIPTGKAKPVIKPKIPTSPKEVTSDSLEEEKPKVVKPKIVKPIIPKKK